MYGSDDTVSFMAKTTIDISDELLAEAKALAVRERTTLRELVERGLRSVVRRRAAPERFRLRDASVDGDGLNPEFEGAGWERIRDALYESERP
jgi:Arc/MetJ family transcription regulator